MGIQLCRLRTTIIKIGEQWELCEFQEPLEFCESLEDLLPGVIMPVPVLTIMHREQLGIEMLGEYKLEASKPPEVPRTA